MAKQLRTFPGLFIIPVALAVLIFSVMLGSASVYGQREPYHTYFPLVLSGCSNAIPSQPPANLTVETETLAALNHERALEGKSPLARNESLVQIARYHSMDMAVSEKLIHTGSEGDTLGDRFGWLCESFASGGEIIGWSTSGSVDNIVNAWMESDGHRDIILDAVYTVAGVGYVYYPENYFKHIWTVDFASKASTRESTDSLLSQTVCTVETFTFDEGGIQITQCD